MKQKLISNKVFKKFVLCTGSQFTDSYTAEKEREEENLKCAFETAKQKEQKLENQERVVEKGERNTEDDREGMLSRKCVCRRAKIENADNTEDQEKTANQ